MKKTKLGMGIFLGTVACFVLSYVCAKAAGMDFTKDNFVASVTQRYADKHIEGLKSVEMKRIFSAENLSEISVDTQSIDIRFEPEDVQDVTVNFKSFKSSFNPEKQIATRIDGERLVIETDEKTKDSSWDISISDGKGIVVTYPKNIRELSIRTVSGEVTIDGKNLKSVDVETTSGNITVNGVKTIDANLQTVSGKIEGSLFANQLDIKTISGDCNLRTENNTPVIHMSTTSGDGKLLFIEKPNASVSLASVSGSINFEGDFGVTDVDAKKANIKLGNGKGLISLKTISGSLTIAK